MAGSAVAETDRVEEALAHGQRLLRGDPDAAVRQAREILRAYPHSADAYRLLGTALRRIGQNDEAEEAELEAIAVSVHDSELMQAARALVDNDLPAAEHILRGRLKDKPIDVAAIRMMAELAARIGRYQDAENLLRRALELAPGFSAARSNLAMVLHRQNRPAEAINVLDGLLGQDPENATARNMKAAVLGRIGGYDEAIELYRDVLKRFPKQPKIWMSLGHVLKTVGRTEESIAAYRRAIELEPQLGEVWWSLANLKTVKFSDTDVAAMRRALDAEALCDEDRFHLHFALGKAFEDKGEAASSFTHYAEGNRLRRAMIHYDPEETTRHVNGAIHLFSADFLRDREGFGCLSPDPIFILGMPRAGSTLIEQILASHPLIEGTMELPDIPALSRELGVRQGRANGSYAARLASLDAEALRSLGEQYLERTRIQRKTEKPYFIDKLPNNWLHIGFIQLILPNAKIIDARRDPMDCCFSNFKQHFAKGQPFSYNLDEMGRYYRDYVRLLRHFDDAMPGRICRVIHEDLIEDPEGEVRQLLNYLGVEYDPACLRFYENERAVRTASSEQVRRPLNREGIGRWKFFDQWLEPLKTILGPIVNHYPDVPVGHLG